jgi:hypothetical protein
LDGITSEYGKARLTDPKLDELRFSYDHKPKVAKEGKEHSNFIMQNRVLSLLKWNMLPSEKIKE